MRQWRLSRIPHDISLQVWEAMVPGLVGAEMVLADWVGAEVAPVGTEQAAESEVRSGETFHHNVMSPARPQCRLLEQRRLLQHYKTDNDIPGRALSQGTHTCLANGAREKKSMHRVRARSRGSTIDHTHHRGA